MTKIYSSAEELIGTTPLVELKRVEEHFQLNARILAKLEYLNPAGSAKDRVAFQMIEDAQACGALRPGGVVIESTSGNTGIGLAMVCAIRGYRLIIVMPDSMSVERRKLLAAYGAELVLTEGAKGMAGANEKAEALHAAIPGSIVAGQFCNPANPAAHTRTTGPEIWEDTEGRLDCFVAGVGTGGTITGVGRFLKARNPDIRIVAVEPASSPLLSKGHAGSHGLQGIGSNFVPEILDTGIYDEVACVTDEQAYEAGRLLAKREGILCGITSGAALHAAIELAKRDDFAGRTICCLLPDTGDRYLSTPLFDE